MLRALLAWFRPRIRQPYGRDTKRELESALAHLTPAGRPEALADASHQAVALLSRILERHPDDPQLRFHRGVAFGRQALQSMADGSSAPRAWVHALEDFRRVYPTQSCYEDAAFGQAILFTAAGLDLLRRGDPGKLPFQNALKVLVGPSPAPKSEPEFLLLAALVHTALCQPGEALQVLRRISLPPAPSRS